MADRYTVERKIGAGGMADVYLAHDVRHNRRIQSRAPDAVAGWTLNSVRLRRVGRGDRCVCSVVPRSAGETSEGFARAWIGTDVDARGTRAGMLPGEQRRPRIIVVLNWFEELRVKVPR